MCSTTNGSTDGMENVFSSFKDLRKKLVAEDAEKGEGLTPELIHERNEIIATWYKSPRLNYAFHLWKSKFPDIRELRLEGDHKNDIFYWLLCQPIQFLRVLDESQWVSYLYKKIIVNKSYENSKKQKIAPDAPRLVEFDSERFNDLFSIEETKEAVKKDLLLECIAEVQNLPYIQREAIIAYAKKSHVHPTIDLLKSLGIQINHSTELKTLLTEARETIQNRLLHRGIIEKKIPFAKLFWHEKKSIKGIANKIMAAKFMLRALGMLAANYNKDWSFSSKLLYILLDHNTPVTSYYAYKKLIGKHEPELKTEKGEEWLFKSAGKYFAILINAGIVTKRRISEKGSETEYFFPAPVQEWLSDIIAKRLFNISISGLIWQVYLRHEERKFSIEKIAADLKISVPVAKKSLAQASDILDEVFRLRALNPLITKVRK